MCFPSVIAGSDTLLLMSYYLTVDSTTPLHQFILDLTFHFKKTTHLHCRQDSGELIDIAHTDGVCLLLTLHLAFCQLQTLLVGKRL